LLKDVVIEKFVIDKEASAPNRGSWNRFLRVARELLQNEMLSDEEPRYELGNV
jgi:hypothetical protein